MAKKHSTPPTSPQRSESPAGSSNSAADKAVEERVVQFAEQLGRVIGTVQAKADGWLDRTALTAQISSIRDAAADLLEHVAGGAGTPAGDKAAASAESNRNRSRAAAAVAAPGKKHRKPAPTVRGAKHSDERIAKLKVANANRQRRSGGGR